MFAGSLAWFWSTRYRQPASRVTRDPPVFRPMISRRLDRSRMILARPPLRAPDAPAYFKPFRNNSA